MTNELSVWLEHSYEDAISAVTAALKVEGFGVLTEIDVKQTLKSKIDANFFDRRSVADARRRQHG